MKAGKGNATSRKLRTARYTVRYHERDMERYRADLPRFEIAVRRYEKACALLVAHKFIAPLAERGAERQ